MKLKYMFMAAAMCLGMTSCSEDELNPESIFESNETMPENDFDRWLKTNYVDEYNIQVKYRFEFNESDKGYNLVPAEYDKAVAIAKLTKYLWLDAYAKVMGNTFIRTYCPKLIHLVGSPQYNTDGSVSIGVAEGGMKISKTSTPISSTTGISIPCTMSLRISCIRQKTILLYIKR